MYKKMYLEEKVKHCESRLESAALLAKIAELQSLYVNILKDQYNKELETIKDKK